MSLDVFGVDRLRPLPRPVKPFHNETIESYLDRLADANRLDREALRIYIAGDHHKAAPIPLHRLSLLSGQPAQALRNALPDVSTAKEATEQVETVPVRRRPGRHALVRPACTRCAAARGITTSVECLLRLEDVVCARHQRWLGQRGSPGHHQPNLANQPEILLANRRHHRLLRRHDRVVTETAYRAATRICEQWRERPSHDRDFHRLMNIFHAGHWRVLETDPTVEAATYPQVIALTRLLASPVWRGLPFTGPAGVQTFTAEVRRTVASDFTWNTRPYYRYLDPLVRLFLDETARQLNPLSYAYPAPIFTLEPTIDTREST
jgi:hypothetical protein